MAGIASAEQFHVIEISISSERFKSGQRLYLAGERNKAPVVAEVNIYEHIFAPYLTGSLIMIDDNDVYRVADLKGTERVHIRFQIPDAVETQVSKTFVITNIGSSTKTTDTATLLELQLMEAWGYASELETFNKSYTGTGPQIIENILADKLSKTLKKDYWNEPHQQDLRYIIPWQTPFEAMKTLTNAMCTSEGLPYFLFSTLASDELILTDLQSILNRPAFNKDLPFVYSAAMQAKAPSGSKGLERMATNILQYEANNLEETLILARSGAIGSAWNFIDLESGSNTYDDIDMLAEFDRLNSMSILPTGQKRIPIDTKYRREPEGTDDKALNELSSAFTTTFGSNPYVGVQTLVNDYQTSKLLVIKNNYIKHLFNNVQSIYVPGLLFTSGNIESCVGHQLKLKILSSSSTEDSKGTPEDEKRSGDFVILSKRHILNIIDGIHNVSLSLGRVANQPRYEL